MNKVVRWLSLSSVIACGSATDRHAPDALDGAVDGPLDATLPAQEASVMVGERITALANVDLRIVQRGEPGLHFATAVVGLRTFELLSLQNDVVQASALAAFDPPAPARRNSPLFVYPIDVDCDGREDLGLSGLGEAYVVRALADGSYGAREPWLSYLPPDVNGAYDQRLRIGERALFATYALDRSVPILYSDACTFRTGAAASLAEAPAPGAFVIGWPSTAGGTSLVIQERPGAERFELAADGGLSGPTTLKLTPAPPYLSAFDAIDAPTPLVDRNGCERRALGVGRVASNAAHSVSARRELRRLQLFTFAQDSVRWRDIEATSGVVAYGIADGGEQLYLGVVRAHDRGHELQLLALSGCDSVAAIAQLPIEFEWRTPPAPLQGRLEEQQSMNGSKAGFVPRYEYPTLLPALFTRTDGAASIVFAHYDGYDARAIHAHDQSGAWSLRFRKTTLHEVRDDLAFPYTAEDLARERDAAAR